MKLSELQRGDLVEISYKDEIFFNCMKRKLGNKVLITNVFRYEKGISIVAVWYDDEELKGLPYQISKNQEITRLIKRNVDVDKFFQENKIERNYQPSKYNWKVI